MLFCYKIHNRIWKPYMHNWTWKIDTVPQVNENGVTNSHRSCREQFLSGFLSMASPGFLDSSSIGKFFWPSSRCRCNFLEVASAPWWGPKKSTDTTDSKDARISDLTHWCWFVLINVDPGIFAIWVVACDAHLGLSDMDAANVVKTYD